MVQKIVEFIISSISSVIRLFCLFRTENGCLFVILAITFVKFAMCSWYYAVPLHQSKIRDIMKKRYQKLELSPLHIISEDGFLAGSLKKAKIQTGEVKVEDFTDGFAGSTTSEDWTISF